MYFLPSYRLYWTTFTFLYFGLIASLPSIFLALVLCTFPTWRLSSTPALFNELILRLVYFLRNDYIVLLLLQYIPSLPHVLYLHTSGKKNYFHRMPNSQCPSLNFSFRHLLFPLRCLHSRRILPCGFSSMSYMTWYREENDVFSNVFFCKVVFLSSFLSNICPRIHDQFTLCNGSRIHRHTVFLSHIFLLRPSMYISLPLKAFSILFCSRSFSLLFITLTYTILYPNHPW